MATYHHPQVHSNSVGQIHHESLCQLGLYHWGSWVFQQKGRDDPLTYQEGRVCWDFIVWNKHRGTAKEIVCLKNQDWTDWKCRRVKIELDVNNLVRSEVKLKRKLSECQKVHLLPPRILTRHVHYFIICFNFIALNLLLIASLLVVGTLTRPIFSWGRYWRVHNTYCSRCPGQTGTHINHTDRSFPRQQ